jgi:hypothetical protein
LRLLRSLLNTRLFTRSSPLVSAFEIIVWWEGRRLPFKLIVGATGVFTCATILAIMLIGTVLLDSPESTSTGDGPEAIAGVIFIMAYALAANVCYTGGWIAEIIARKVWGEKAEHLGEIAFALGLGFSVVLTLVSIYGAPVAFTAQDVQNAS